MVRASKADTMRPREAHRPWETFALDLMEPYPRSAIGKRFLLVVTDLFTRWIEAFFSIASSEATKLTSILELEVFSRWRYSATAADSSPASTGPTLANVGTATYGPRRTTISYSTLRKGDTRRLKLIFG